MSAFRARPGTRLVQIDAQSLEPTIQAEFSGDLMLRELYDPNKHHDMYLFNGLHLLEPLYPDRCTKLREMYDATDPDKVAACKAEFKHERSNILKALVLSDQYGAGVGSWHNQLTRNGIEVSRDAVVRMKEIHEEKYSGLMAWDRALQREWRLNKGYILNGIGRIRCVSPKITKDLRNVFAQSTGHDFLLMTLVEMQRLVDTQGIVAYPWLDDLHDETIWEVREDHVSKMSDIMVQAFDIVNDNLKWGFRIQGTPEIGDTLWDFKS